MTKQEFSPSEPEPEKEGEETPPIIEKFVEALKSVDKEMLKEDAELKEKLEGILERAKEEMDEIIKSAEKHWKERN